MLFRSFTDAVGAQALAQALEADDAFEARLLKRLDANYEDTRSWATEVLDKKSKANVVLFTSGDGDGNFPTFVGLDAKGKLTAMLTDFLLTSYE